MPWILTISRRNPQQDHICKSIAWLTKMKLSGMISIADTDFEFNITSNRRGFVCEKVLEILLHDPELPTIPGFDDRINEHSVESTPDIRSTLL